MGFLCASLCFLSPCDASEESAKIGCEKPNGAVAGDIVPAAIHEKPFAPVLGTHVPEFSNEKQDVYLIANGHLGMVRIYRVQPKAAGEKPYIVKEYDWAYKQQIELQGYKTLARLIDSKHGIDTFKIQHVVNRPGIRRKDHTALEDVRGKSLDQILMDEDVPDGLKAKLREAYVKKLEGLHQIIKLPHHYPEAIASKAMQDGLPTYGYSEWSNVGGQYISIRASQILVTFDPLNPYKFDMTIIDPA